MAAATGLSEKSVRRIWHKHGLKPHLTRTFKLSNDPQFAEKLETIVGLYLNLSFAKNASGHGIMLQCVHNGDADRRVEES
jgi:hypothetical protein